ncbi:MAG TPA: RNA 2',3'-cyclic phosphodiesterase [Chloroflexia bacterium]|nr:RNA 2',3'-cyclic phosphodiesterase [Chloroflexia bacterium]
MYRLFVAIDLPESVRAMLSRLCFGVPGARWTPDEQFHLTLRFIGEADPLLYRDIKKALGEVFVDPFELTLKGVGHFPPRGRPNVLWVGIEKNETLVKLRNRVENALVQTGVEPEGRKFSPHITLARLKDTPINRVGDFLTENALFQAGPFPVNEFYLYSSVLTSKGAHHTVEETYSLL